MNLIDGKNKKVAILKVITENEVIVIMVIKLIIASTSNGALIEC